MRIQRLPRKFSNTMEISRTRNWVKRRISLASHAGDLSRRASTAQRPTLRLHPKFRRLKYLLSLPTPYAMGLLECLWDVAYQSGDVDSRSRCLECGNIFAESGISKFICCAEQIHGRRRIASEPGGCCTDAAVSGDHCRYSLRQLRKHFRRPDCVEVIMSMGVDESRGQNLVFTIHDVMSGELAHIANFSYPVASNRDIAVLDLSATAIEDPDVTNYGVALKHSLS